MTDATEAARHASLHEQIAVLESQAKRAQDEARALRRDNESLRSANGSLQRDFEHYRERWMQRGYAIGKLNERIRKLEGLVREMHSYVWESGIGAEGYDAIMAAIDELGIEVG